MKKRLFIQSVFPAPYRVEVFRKLGMQYNIFVAFERDSDNNRSEEWFSNQFGFNGIIVNTNDAQVEYEKEVKNLKSYDAILAYDYSSVSSIKLMLKCISLQVPYLVNCDGAFINNNIIKKAIKKFFISRAKACLASGEFAERYFLAYGAKKENIFRHHFSSLNKEDILNNLISYEEKKEIRERLGLPIDKKIVLSVGQFTHRKGYDVLLNTWRLVNDQAQLIIVGGGEKEQDYKQFIKDNNIENVIIEGFKPKKILFDYYKASDLFVLPTREDVWGLVINEAMACGLPVITTDKCVAGLELIENSKNGFIVPTEDHGKLTEKIEVILEDDEMRLSMGRESLNKIRSYNIENIVNSHINTLELILGGSQ